MRTLTSLFLVSLFMGIILPAQALDEYKPEKRTITREEAEQECAPYPTVPINIYPVFDEPKYDFSIDINGLQQIASDPNHNMHGGHQGLKLGLTHYEPVIQLRAPIHSISIPHGVSCAHVQNVDVSIGYRNVTVYIPHEVRQGSCGFNEVMTHEQKHIKVNEDILDQFAPVIVKRLQDYLRYNGVMREDNQQFAVDTLNRKLNEILEQTAKEMYAENSRRQALVDTPEEYRRVSFSCNGELQAVARPYAR